MPREVRDAIHGLIELNPTEWKVIDSEPFQRLRGIQQLALTNLLYPGARHSRFEHSLGVCHIAGRIAKRLNDTQENRVRTDFVRLAALVHDIGHGPFSHVSEKVMKRHEHVSAAIVRYHPEVRGAIGDYAEEVANLLVNAGRSSRRTVERDIIDGPVDADKLDYLLRDSHFCGVEYGKFDLEKIVESARSVSLNVGDHAALGFSEACVYALEELVLARYHMHRQVYGHRVRVAIDEMLVKAMRLGLQEDSLPSNVFQPEGDLDEEFVTRFLNWDDASVTRALLNGGGRSGQLMDCLQRRQLFKQVFRLNRTDIEQRFGRTLAGPIALPDFEGLGIRTDEVEREIADEVGVEPHWLALHWEDVKSPVLLGSTPGIADREIVLINKSGELPPFENVSEVFQPTESPSKPAVSFFVGRPSGRFSEDEMLRFEKAAYEALKRIGEKSYAV